MSLMTIVQIASVVANVLLIVVFGVGYYYLYVISRNSLEEMREDRIAGGRPQVILEADYQRLPEIDLVVRNVGDAPAKDITFEFSDTIKSSTGFVLSDLFYLKEGMDFLGPEGEIRCLWDDLDSLENVLEAEGLQQGIEISAHYYDLDGRLFEGDWRINPLLYQGIRNADRKDIEDLVQAVEKLSGGSGEARAQSSEVYEQQSGNEDVADGRSRGAT